MQSIVDIEIWKILTDLNVSDPLTKLLSQAKHDHTLVFFGLTVWNVHNKRKRLFGTNYVGCTY